ncbi:MAG TPA: hypothetical protein VKA58_13575 [Propionibacteriaceae bacterium]|nr:hypothetical protein [Propionibacteriaceae bacterium]
MTSLVYVPPGWPAQIRPPGAPDWESTAIGFLLDCCPPDFRAYRVLRNHPVVLARFAARFVEGQHRCTQEGLAEIRTSLKDLVASGVIEAAAEAWLAEDARLARTRRAVLLVEQALRGQAFVRKL